ncbi:TIGR02206 family membrane protein [uncultured Psychroserpens sp.]|uniref:YwaF family protein n=1 Tax=uncultured Psychroserpens sp. TaxID=255436 RepID=UPI0026139662|nr:TIGR02206 family membrane protein [uncultured Psychroserpens sp.]
MINLSAALHRVLIFSWEHLLPIGIATVFAVALIRYAKQMPTEKQQRLIHYIAVFISTTVIGFHVYHMLFSTYDFRTDLPLYLCSLLGILIPIYTYYRRYWMFEILVFWIIAGTLQGVITPDIAVGFPSFDYFRYWIVHLGLLIVMFYSIYVLDFKPKLKSVFKSFLALQVYVGLMIFINYLLNANYFYLNEKPKSASLLDYFGEWPYYIIACQLIIIPLFLIIYLPFYFRRTTT